MVAGRIRHGTSPWIENSPVPIILDHFAGIDITQDQVGLAGLVHLLQKGHVWVKMSAPYRLPNRPTLTDVEHLARQLAEARSDPAAVGVGLTAHGSAAGRRRAHSRICGPVSVEEARAAAASRRSSKMTSVAHRK